MKNGERQIRVRYPRFWLGLVALVLAALVVFLVVTAIEGIFPGGNNITKTKVTPPSLTTQRLTSTPRETTREMFGPWHLLVGKGTGAPNLVMLDPGGAMEVSSKVVAIGKSWQVQAPIDIVSEKYYSTTVKFSTGGYDIYTVSYGQAFVLSDDPGSVYGFSRSSSGKVVLVGTSVQALKS